MRRGDEVSGFGDLEDTAGGYVSEVINCVLTGAGESTSLVPLLSP